MMKNQEPKKKTKVECPSCDSSYTVTAQDFPDFCCFCAETLSFESKMDEEEEEEESDDELFGFGRD